VTARMRRPSAPGTPWCLLLSIVVLSAGVAAPIADTAKCESQADMRLAVAQHNLTEGDRSLAAGNHEEAIAHFKNGVVQLGDQAAQSPTLDDSGQRLALATIEERNGRLKVAAHLLRNALATRVSIYARQLNAARQTIACPDAN
jgi:hypothetical protein